MAALDSSSVQSLLDEGHPDNTTDSAPSALPTGAASVEARDQSSAAAATPAEVVVGSRMVRSGVSQLLIEKFDFGKAGAPATLQFGVHVELQLNSDATMEEVEEMKDGLTKKIDALRHGRHEALLDRVSS